AVQGREGTLEPVGGHVVRDGVPPGDRVRGAPRVAPVAAEQGRRGFTVAASRPPHEVPVTRFTHSSAVWYERADLARPGRAILRVWTAGRSRTTRSCGSSSSLR